MTTQIFGNIIGGIAVVLLTAIAGMCYRVFRKINRFMLEHVWLLTTTLWTRDKVILMMHHMNISIDDIPPANLPGRKLWQI